MLTDSEKTSIRLELEKLFDKNITVKRPQHVSDGAGGWTLSTTTVGTYKAFVRPYRALSEADITVATAETLRERLIISTKHDADIKKGDILSMIEGDFEIIELRMDGSNDFMTELIVMRLS